MNGLSNTGYWYQAGLAYDWPMAGGGFNVGFNFSYEVWGPDGSPVFPGGNVGGGLSSFNGSVNVGDSVCLQLSFSGDSVLMSASDSKTGAYASQTYSRQGAVNFMGLTSGIANSNGYFSGLMTEWHHTEEFSGNEAQVPYFLNSNDNVTEAWMWMQEQELNPPLLLWTAPSNPSPVQYGSEPNQLQEFASNGATEYSDANEFETGAPALCALKTGTNGLFYIPNPAYANATSMRVEMLFDNLHLIGDQSAGSSPYPAIANYPDNKVDIKDIAVVSKASGSIEGSSNWNYMADIIPDRKVDTKDIAAVAKNYGQNGSYISYVWVAEIQFNTGDEEFPDATGFLPIPASATSFNVTTVTGSIGAMILFCGS